MALTYFAADGSYGDANGLVIIDTRAWSPEDWSAVESAGDYTRANVAHSMALLNGDI